MEFVWRCDPEIGELKRLEPNLVMFTPLSGNKLVIISVEGKAGDTTWLGKVIFWTSPGSQLPRGPQIGQVCIVAFEDLDYNGLQGAREGQLEDFRADILDQRGWTVTSKSPDDEMLEGGWCRNLPLGEYNIHIRHPAFMDRIEGVRVGADGKEQVRIPLQPRRPPTASPTAVLASTPTPYPTPNLYYPEVGHEFYKEIAEFEWHWPGPLGQQEYFRIKAWKEGLESNPTLNWATKDQAWSWWPDQGAGRYTCRVEITGEGDHVGLSSDSRVFWYEPPKEKVKPWWWDWWAFSE